MQRHFHYIINRVHALSHEAFIQPLRALMLHTFSSPICPLNAWKWLKTCKGLDSYIVRKDQYLHAMESKIWGNFVSPSDACILSLVQSMDIFWCTLPRTGPANQVMDGLSRTMARTSSLKQTSPALNCHASFS